MNYHISINLMQLVGAKVIQEEGEDGIFIPFRRNSVAVMKNGSYLHMSMIQKSKKFLMKTNTIDTHHLVIAFGKNKKQEFREEDIKHVYCGNAHPYEKQL